MDWEWKEMPPTCLEVKAGTTIELCLDIEWLGEPALIRWEPTRLGKGTLQTDQCEPRRASVTIPPPQLGLFVVSYEILGSPTIQGMLLLRTAPSSLDDLPTPQPPDMSRMQVSEKPAFSPESNQSEVVTSVRSSSQTRVLPKGDYMAEVWCGDRRIDELTQMLPPHRRIIVGRYSVSLGLLPDIDLVGHFPTEESESFCARRQACIYWQGREIQIHNLGLNPLEHVLPDGTREALPHMHRWALNERIELPGGLSLLLQRRAS
jgi:hypothetical protein